MQLGIDIIEIQRLEQAIQRTGDAFLKRVYTPEELAAMPAGNEAHRLEYLAGRWAAKEALAKALGCGIGESCAMGDICVINDENGAPHIKLYGAAAVTAEKSGIIRWQVSISHEQHYAVAAVIGETN